MILAEYYPDYQPDYDPDPFDYPVPVGQVRCPYCGYPIDEDGCGDAIEACRRDTLDLQARFYLATGPEADAIAAQLFGGDNRW